MIVLRAGSAVVLAAALCACASTVVTPSAEASPPSARARAAIGLADRTLVVINTGSPTSVTLGNDYVARRAI